MSDESQATPTEPLEATGALKIGMLRPGTLVLQGRFKVLELLGRGGMGDVYLAEQVSLGRKVALKTLREDLSLQPGMTERFKREARLLSTVDHPSIVRVIDFGEAESTYVLVMEYVEGENLATEVRRGPLEPPRALAVMKDIAEGLASIHAQGIIHRDLKPDNVLLTRGPEGERARLLDFGIARLAEEQGAAITQAGLVLGTPEYLSPEQATGMKIDARSDVYAFGVLAYRLLAGRHPFAGPSARDFLLQHITQAPPELASVAPELADQPALLALVMSCLSKEPASRPDGGKGLLAALANLAARPPPIPAGPPPLASTVPSKQVSVATGASVVAGKAKNLAVVLTDIKGFAELSASLSHDENARLLADHHRLVLMPLKSLGGHLVHRWQDRAVATFESPTAAVQFGMAVQDGVWRYNATVPPGRQLGVGVAIHVGEVVVAGETILGEPAQLVTEAAKTSASGEVVFTQAVWLSMNRVGVPAEPRGALSLPGRADLSLYRCTPTTEGAPFGGRDLQVRQNTGAALVVRSKTVASAVKERLWRVNRKIWLGALGAVAVVAILAGGISALSDPTQSRATELLDQGQPAAALELLMAAKGRNEAPLRLLRAEAQHQLKRHREEWDLVGGTNVAGLEKLRPAALAALLDDFLKNDRDEVVRTALSRLPEGQLDRVKKWAEGPPSAAQWAAVRYLDTIRAAGFDFVPCYVVALESTDCNVCALAARRLADFADRRAIEPLERLKSSPRKQGLFFAESCGHDEAEAALEKLNPPVRE